MSMEQPKLREVDIESGMTLINEHPLLKDDEAIKKIVQTGLSLEGKPVDLINVIAARAAFLEKNQADMKLEALEKKDPAAYNVAVMHSPRPEMEKGLGL